MNRRELLIGSAALAGTALIPKRVGAHHNQSIVDSSARWVCTTQTAPWQGIAGLEVTALNASSRPGDFEVRLDQPGQVMEGIGGAFSELGWDAVRLLPASLQDSLIASLFEPAGANFNLGRTPIGADDFSRRWYSYDETDGDFRLDRFSVANDDETLVPFIKAAMAHRPDLKLWASPWSPPTWMKTNKHYAMSPNAPDRTPNGLRPDQQRREGEDAFVQDPRYFDAYARYFRAYVEAYRVRGIPIRMVMPQNEFNSAQSFPSCVWTPEGLARFIPYLGREMEKSGVDIFFGTFERPDAGMVDRVLAVPEAARFVKGVGVQWGGKRALAQLRERHPALPLWQTEQECGMGTNDWHYARYTWDLMKHYLGNGTTAYFYWNLVLPTGGMSTWGWPQNSLITVDPSSRTYRFNHEYWLMLHLSRTAPPGARRVETRSYTGFENQLAFRHPDGSVAIMIQNDMGEPLAVRMNIADRQVHAVLPPDSFSTITLPPTAVG